ncbi:MAG: M56 family metallopeptidase [Clostridia bacterium]|nr:M56 family metallopeptidase [Clostridia bacterium]
MLTADTLFLNVFHMSLSASWLILAVCLLRLLLKKAPKSIRCLLWGLVALRLLCPVSIESAYSLIPTRSKIITDELLYAEDPRIETGVAMVDKAIAPVVENSLTPQPGASVNPIQVWLFAAEVLWGIGIGVMLLYAVCSRYLLGRRVAVSVPDEEERVRLCDEINTPFILGMIQPHIYLPSSMSDIDRACVLAHERAHIKRLDHLWKPLGFALLTVYWFNPLVWIAYILLCRDIELACDEYVIRDMNKEDTAAYTEALLRCSAKQKFVSACPLAFGESGVKARIKNALHYKKPALWLILLALVTCIAVTVCFLTDPLSRKRIPGSIGAGSELDGVSVAVKALNLTADTPTVTIRWQNDTDKDLIYGESFRLYRLEDGQLVDTNLIKNSAFSAIGWMLAPYQHVDKAYTLSGYNLSENGIYRFESTIGIHGGEATSYTVWADFAVENSTATTPLIAASAPYMIEDAVLPDTKNNVRVVYPILKSDVQDVDILNEFLKSNLQTTLYYLQKEHPRNSAIDLHYTVTYDDGTLISVLFEGTVTPPDGDGINVAFTACLAPGNGYTVNPESLFTMDEHFLNSFREKWLALWDDANLTFQKGQEIQSTIHGYSNEELASLLRNDEVADFGFSADGILVVFRGKPKIGDYTVITVPYNRTARAHND